MAASRRIPTLDGLRAVAASMVVFGHSYKALEVGRHLPRGAGVVNAWGPVGVSLFFVLSGFLITKLLLEERRGTGGISLRAFYVRRAFRILPAYWTYLVVVGLLAAAGWVIATPGSFARAFAFTTNYLNPHSWVVNQSWSLSVEEQFYLLWPALVVLLGATRARKTALALIFITPLVRIGWYYALPAWRSSITSMLHLRIDALMIGCWAALELEATDGKSRVLDFLAKPWVAAVSAFYMLCVAFVVRRAGVLNPALAYTLSGFGALSLIIWGMRNATSRVGRVLNSAPLVHVGLLSYSLYLWQQLWMVHEGPTPVWFAPIRIACALACAELSYRLVERPMLNLRATLKLARPAQRPVPPPRAAA